MFSNHRIVFALLLICSFLFWGCQDDTVKTKEKEKGKTETGDISKPEGNKKEAEETDARAEGKKCVYDSCMIQEINIVSARKAGKKTKFYYVHAKTTVTHIDKDGQLNTDKEVVKNEEKPNPMDPDLEELVKKAKKASGKTLDELLDTADDKGTGSSVHEYGCAKECRCVKRYEKITLPDGKEILNPGMVKDGGYPRGKNSKPDINAPVALISQRVDIPGMGTYLITYEIRLFGTVRVFRGNCK